MGFLRDEALGKYILSFFVIEINEKIDFMNPSQNDNEKELGTFFHEYIHFLQDISCTYGYMNIACFFGRIMGYLYQASNSKENYINRIIKLSEDAETVWDIYSITMGEVDEWSYDSYNKIEIINHSYIKDDSFDEKYQQFTTPILNLKLIDGYGREYEKEFYFGAMAVMESMAYLIEEHLYPRNRYDYQVQYDICRLLWNTLMPKYKDKKELIVAACDAALLYDNPGQVYYCILRQMSREGVLITNQNDIYKFFTERLRPYYSKGLELYYNESLKHINEIIPKENDFYRELNHYVVSYISRIYNERNRDMLFISKIMLMEKNEAKRYICNIITQFKAVPLIIEKGGEIYSGIDSNGNTNDMIAFVALYAFYNLFSIYGKDVCYMQNICKSQISELCDEHCKKAPWEKVHDFKLCPLAQIWHIWQLDGKTLKNI